MMKKRRYKDLIGNKYGKLTVIKFHDYEYLSNGSPTIRWLCKCDCGKETVVRGTSLTSGHSRSCGCARYDNRKPVHINMLGMKIGSWTVIEQIGLNKHRECIWLCKCDCGNIKKFRGVALRNGVGLKCTNCHNDKLTENKSTQLVGCCFGRWTVLSFDEYKISKTNGRKYRYWNCQCECGTIKSVRESSLTLGKSQSCGCLRKEVCEKLVTFDDLSGRKYGNLTVLRRVADRIYPCGMHLQNYECLCDCGNISYVTRPMLVSSHTRSCGCAHQSFLEQDVIRYLSENNIEYMEQKTFQDLLGLGGKYLSYDFYIKHNDIYYIIECQGEQHFKPIKYFGGVEKFKIQQAHDKLKKEYCDKRGIRYIEILFSMNIKDIYEVLNQAFFGEENKQN